MLRLQQKNTSPSKLILALQVPTLKQKVSSEHNPYLLSHKAVLKLSFTHNHPITAAHSHSFRPISESTKNDFFELFNKEHCASSARHTHEQKLILNSETDAEKQHPNVQDICRLFIEWRIKNYGKEDGTEMFKMLQHEVDFYNEKNQSLGGKALLHGTYEITVTMKVAAVVVTAKKYQDQRKRNRKYHKNL